MDYECFLEYALLPVMAAILAIVIFLLVWLPMRRLLGANSRLKRARAFFVRACLLALLLGALAPVVGEKLDLPKDTQATTQAATGPAEPLGGASFWEAVWDAADELEGSFIAVGLYLFGFVVILTVLAATLGKYRDE